MRCSQPLTGTVTSSQHVYEVRPRKDHRGVDLISEALPFGLLWYGQPNAVSNAIGYAMHRSRSHRAVIRVYDQSGNVFETHEHTGDFIAPIQLRLGSQLYRKPYTSAQCVRAAGDSSTLTMIK